MTEGERQFDAVGIGGVDDGTFTEGAAAFGVFAGEQMATSGLRTEYFALGRDFKPLGHRFLCLLSSGATHNSPPLGLPKDREI